MATENEYRNLGYANGWGDAEPEAIMKCEEDEKLTGIKHKRESYYVYKCVTRYICHTCKYYYHVDSGD